MKKLEIFAVVAFLTVSLSLGSHAYNDSIYLDISKPPVQESVGEIRNFWINDGYYGHTGWRNVSAVLINVTNISYIYVELREPDNNPVWYNGSNNGYITREDADSIAEEFQKIYYKDRLYFGEERPVGVDGNSHVTIFLLDIDGDYANNWSGSGYTGGYYLSTNEYSNSTLGCTNCIYSNQRKMVYIDTYPLIENGNSTGRVPDRWHNDSNFAEGVNKSFSKIAHEFQHMIHWYHDPQEDSWVNEGISDYAEFLNGYGSPESHVDAFLKNPGNSLTLWNGTLEDYGAAYLFILYLSEHYGGYLTIKDLVNNTRHGIDGVNDTLRRTGYNDAFQSIFPRWAVANIIDDTLLDGGIYGYNEINASVDSKRISSYPANSAGNMEAWSSNYVNFSNGNSSNLNISVTVSNSRSFNVSLIKMQNNSKIIDRIPFTGNIGSEIIDGFGSLYRSVIMVVSSSTGGNYSYSAVYSSVVITTTTSTTTTSATTTTTLGTTTSSTSTSTTITLPQCQVKGDQPPCDGSVNDFELLDYISQWAKGIVQDFDLLEAINNWAKI